MELLTVLSITGFLALLSVPALQAMQRAGAFDKALYTIADSLNFAHTYAVANHTYVYVGLTEVDRTQNSMATPQKPGVGRVVLSIVATADGTSDTNSWSTNGANITQVRSVQTFDFLHIASTGSFLTGTGTMAAPMSGGSTIPTTLVSVPAGAAPLTPFSLPLGSSSGNGRYNFSDANSQILCFNPQGGVLLNGTAVQELEIDLQPTVGTVTPPAPSNVNQGNQAALLIDGITGVVDVCRP